MEKQINQDEEETDDEAVFKEGHNPLEHWTEGEYEDILACSIDWKF